MDEGVTELTADGEADHDENDLFQLPLAQRDEGNADER
jgi:hypothetical protein